MSTPLTPSMLQSSLREEGFAFVAGEAMRDLLDGAAMTDWADFAASWNDLAPDTYLAATGRHRRRRHATFVIDEAGQIQREAHQPHFQSLADNPLQGNIQRWFRPIRPALADGDSMRRIIDFSYRLFAPLRQQPATWHVEAHQFRIEAMVDEAGEPTPEGVHRDGVDYVLVLLVDRENIESGTTTIHDDDKRMLGSFTLTHPFDAALVDDARVSHGVTPVTPFDPSVPAHRDVLVVTLRAEFRSTPPG